MNIDGWNGIISVSNVREEMPMNEKQADEIIKLLKEIKDELKTISSETASVNGNTDYTYNVKNIADDILDLLKEKL